jgi:hypothetical protein
MNTSRASLTAITTLLVVFLGSGATSPSTATTAKADSTTDAIARETWPLTIKDGDTTLTVYQPQLDKWDGYTLECRVAVQAALGEKNPTLTYGIVSLTARTLTDKGTRTVTIENAQVVKADFPSASADFSQSWASAIARDLAGKKRTLALDRLEAALAIAYTAGSTQHQPLRNDPPQILFSQVPAILVYIDGAPVYRPFSGSFERIINTRPLVLRDARGAHYLKVFDGWMSATALNAQWSVVSNPSHDLDAAFKQATDARSVDPLTGQTTPDTPAPSLKKTVPAIFIATTPTELLVTDGAPRYVPIKGTQLVYVDNTTGNIFKDTVDNQTYVLIAGRWFRAPGEQGPWQFVAANALPADFAKIPDDSAKENVKASVAGTDQAHEAAIAASIPQTAAVKVSGTRLSTPQFDGEPTFKPIAGSSDLEYVANSALPIVRVYHTTCYALENGVWFVSASASGPWSVATQVPSVIYAIPPSSPLYYVTFVRIYAVNGDTVYEGYTPGYQGTYVDPVTNVVVYGTGYYYDPWTGTVWYGYPVTYGFGADVSYTPWTGWAVAFGIGWAWGAATVAMGWGWGPYPWWGPWGWGWAWGPAFYPWYPAWGAAFGPRGGAVAWGPGGWAGYTGNIYQNWGNRATVWHGSGGYDAWTGNAWASKAGISYNSRTGIASAGQRGAVANVYTGNFATGSRGAAVGPGGGAVIGEHGTAGNAYTGNTVSGGKGAYYNPKTGEWTKFGSVTGEGGRTVAHIGDDVYAGGNGNVYRHTDSGWEQHTSNGWQDVAGDKQGEATRNAAGGLGATQRTPGGEQRSPGERTMPNFDRDRQQLDRDFQARQFGNQRAGQLRESSFGMHRSFGGRMGGGFRRR